MSKWRFSMVNNMSRIWDEHNLTLEYEIGPCWQCVKLWLVIEIQKKYKVAATDVIACIDWKVSKESSLLYSSINLRDNQLNSKKWSFVLHFYVMIRTHSDIKERINFKPIGVRRMADGLTFSWIQLYTYCHCFGRRWVSIVSQEYFFFYKLSWMPVMRFKKEL